MLMGGWKWINLFELHDWQVENSFEKSKNQIRNEGASLVEQKRDADCLEGSGSSGVEDRGWCKINFGRFDRVW